MLPALQAFLAHVLPGHTAEEAYALVEDAIVNMVVFNLSWGLSGNEFERGAAMITVVGALDEMGLCGPRTEREPHFTFTTATKRAIAKMGAIPWLASKRGDLRDYLAAHNVAVPDERERPAGEMAAWSEPATEED